MPSLQTQVGQMSFCQQRIVYPPEQFFPDDFAKAKKSENCVTRCGKCRLKFSHKIFITQSLKVKEIKFDFVQSDLNFLFCLLTLKSIWPGVTLVTSQAAYGINFEGSGQKMFRCILARTFPSPRPDMEMDFN